MALVGKSESKEDRSIIVNDDVPNAPLSNSELTDLVALERDGNQRKAQPFFEYVGSTFSDLCELENDFPERLSDFLPSLMSFVDSSIIALQSKPEMVIFSLKFLLRCGDLLERVLEQEFAQEDELVAEGRVLVRLVRNTLRSTSLKIVEISFFDSRLELSMADKRSILSKCFIRDLIFTTAPKLDGAIHIICQLQDEIEYDCRKLCAKMDLADESTPSETDFLDIPRMYYARHWTASECAEYILGENGPYRFDASKPDKEAVQQQINEAGRDGEIALVAESSPRRYVIRSVLDWINLTMPDKVDDEL